MGVFSILDTMEDLNNDDASDKFIVHPSSCRWIPPPDLGLYRLKDMAPR